MVKKLKKRIVAKSQNCSVNTSQFSQINKGVAIATSNEPFFLCHYPQERNSNHAQRPAVHDM
jgi:hypothetical protein